MKKKLLITFGILVLLAIAGGIWLNYNWYKIPGIVNGIKNPIAKNQPVVWQEGPTTRTSDKPNIIVIMVDDLGFNEVSTYGGGMANGKLKTPNIDQLAEHGVLCTNGYSATSICSPSRAALLTGRFPTRFGYEFTPTGKGYGKLIHYMAKDRLMPPIYNEEIDNQLPPVSNMGLPPSEITIPEMLKPQGYHSVHVGKWHLGGSEEYIPNNHGFDESLWIESGSLFLPENAPDVVNAKLPFNIIDKFVWANLPYAVQHNESDRFEPDGFLTDYLSDEAVKVIEKNKNQPFFLNLAYWAVHRPLQALQSDYDKLDYIEDHAERVQAAMVMSVDRGVGKIRKALKDNGIEDNTIIIFTSDNGAPNYLGLPGLNDPYRGWKVTFFEGGLHIPFIVSYPKSIPSGQTYEGRISNIDIFSTVGTLTGASLPTDREMDGENILPYLTGEQEGEPSRPLFCKSGTYSFLIKNGWKLQVDEMQNKKWLFDLNTDPTEQNNLVATEIEKLTELSKLRQDLLVEQSEPIWKGALTSPVQIDEHIKQELTKEDEYIYWTN
ncbi:MAG: arylsulfatase A-like enzyme [Saprospiraceae bacterium]|jgi:arylsulfatase A-like enzyme